MSKVAIVQFGCFEDKEIAEKLKGQVDWYFFEEDADYDFEIKALYEHYDAIFEFKEIK